VEFNQILNAIGSEAKQWCKCKNDHIYAIGNCGQAMEASVCPDCKSSIGGEHHNLNPTNSVAHVNNFFK